MHAHSCISDGLDTPARLCERARKLGLTALALTDHDTLDGLNQFFDNAEGFDPIGGVELSCGERGSVHVLGYGLHSGAEPLETALVTSRNRRRERGEMILKKLSELGYEVSREGFPTGDAPLGRPHIARALVQSGAFGSVRQAFGRLLGDGKPAYVPYPHLSVEDGVRLIAESGGVAVLAHPYRSHIRGQELRLLLDSLIQKGLQGLEVYHSSISVRRARELDALARSMGLLVTGGSDDHQERCSIVRLGYPASGWTRMSEDYERLKLAISSARPLNLSTED